MVEPADRNDEPVTGRFRRWSPELVRPAADTLPAPASGALQSPDPGGPVPCCAVCSTPVAGPALHDEGSVFHPDCFAVTPGGRCALCGAGLRCGYAHNGRGVRVCLDHVAAAVWCRFCRMLAAGDGRTAPLPPGLDGREGPVCHGCAATAVTTDAVARDRFARVVAWLPSQGLTFPPRAGPRVALADEATIERDRPAEDPDTYGRVFIGVWSEGGRRVRARAYKVLLLRGLPAALLDSVAAHELGHAWLAAQGVLALERPEEEGFCELLAHHWLTALGSEEAAFHAWEIERQRDPIYGEGFRRLHALAAASGWDEVVRSLRDEKRLPGRYTHPISS